MTITSSGVCFVSKQLASTSFRRQVLSTLLVQRWRGSSSNVRLSNLLISSCHYNVTKIVECTLSSEQNVSKTLISLARLRRVKYGKFWLVSGRREIGAEIRRNTGAPGKYGRSNNSTSSVTRGNSFKLSNLRFYHDIRKYAFIHRIMEQFARFCC